LDAPPLNRVHPALLPDTIFHFRADHSADYQPYTRTRFSPLAYAHLVATFLLLNGLPSPIVAIRICSLRQSQHYNQVQYTTANSPTRPETNTQRPRLTSDANGKTATAQLQFTHPRPLRPFTRAYAASAFPPPPPPPLSTAIPPNPPQLPRTHPQPSRFRSPAYTPLHTPNPTTTNNPRPGPPSTPPPTYKHPQPSSHFVIQRSYHLRRHHARPTPYAIRSAPTPRPRDTLPAPRPIGHRRAGHTLVPSDLYTIVK